MTYNGRLSRIERQLSEKERQEIVSRLANYHIPLQILQIVAEECECGGVIAGMKKMPGRTKAPSLVAGLNDQSLIQLRQIFLDCEDSFSTFRLATFLSSKFTPLSYKFVMAKNVHGASDHEYILDVCVYSRNTGDLVAVGMQNNDNEKKPANIKSLQKFLIVISDILATHPSIRSAYYSSSYGYDCDPSHLSIRDQNLRTELNIEIIEIKFLEFLEGVYRQIRR